MTSKVIHFVAVGAMLATLGTGASVPCAMASPTASVAHPCCCGTPGECQCGPVTGSCSPTPPVQGPDKVPPTAPQKVVAALILLGQAAAIDDAARPVLRPSEGDSLSQPFAHCPLYLGLSHLRT